MRQIRTRIPGLMRPTQEKVDKEAQAQDERTRKERKERYDEKNKVKERQVKPGDRVLMKQEKMTVKPPYDPNPYKVVEVKGAQVTCSRGGKEKKRTKEKIKVVKERPEYLKQGGQTTRDVYTDYETEVEINLNVEEENPRDNLEGVGHPRIVEVIEISDDDRDTEVHTDVNREGVGHPIGTNDDEDEFNHVEEIMDKNMDDEEINLVAEPETPEIPEEPRKGLRKLSFISPRSRERIKRNFVF